MSPPMFATRAGLPWCPSSSLLVPPALLPHGPVLLALVKAASRIPSR